MHFSDAFIKSELQKTIDIKIIKVQIKQQSNNIHIHDFKMFLQL